MLADSSDSDDRYELYQLLTTELKLQGDFAGALECARIRLAEFGDIVSRGAFARALLEVGRDVDAIEEFRIAFRAAIESNELINYTFGELMRAAVSIADRETLNSVCEEYLPLKPRRPDCRLEADWFDAAETLGARPELIAELRHRAGQ
jgi:hypothetical protein